MFINKIVITTKNNTKRNHVIKGKAFDTLLLKISSYPNSPIVIAMDFVNERPIVPNSCFYMPLKKNIVIFTLLTVITWSK